MAPSPGAPVGGERPRRAVPAAASASAASAALGDQPMDPEHIDMEAVSAPSEGRYFCPLPGCIAHGASGHAGWESLQA